ncbi:MAG TPA: urease accessory protein UreE [Alphaproteobacteria bacterium]|nr:urease accessory protein UreE [Alphaproteobacteria bacterium]
MERAIKVIRSGAWDRSREQGRITLPFVDRHRRRLVLRADGGTEFLLDLAETTALRAGDGLELESGAIVVVRAADEDLYEVIARSPAELGRLAWHLGNRHLPAQIERERILIRADHVIADMLRGLGASVRAISAPFDPESGAYSGAHGHEHAHDHEHGHDHGHDPGRAHEHAHEHERGRVR